MNKRFLLILASALLASCDAPTPVESEASPEAEITSDVIPSNEEISSAEETTLGESSIEESQQELGIGNWEIGPDDVAKSGSGYPAPYTLDVNHSNGGTVSLSFVDVMWGSGKAAGKTYIQMKKESGSILCATQMKGTLEFGLLLNIVSYSGVDQDMTGYPSVYSYIDGRNKAYFEYPTETEEDELIVSVELDGGFQIEAARKYASMFSYIKFTAHE